MIHSESKLQRKPAFLPLVLIVCLLCLAGTATAAGTTATVSTGPVDVYATGHLGSPVITQLNAGTRVQVVSFDANWAQIELGSGETGYIVTSYLNFGAPVPTSPAPSFTATVRSGPLNVHATAHLGSPIITQLKTGTVVHVVSYNDNWTEIVLTGGEAGYVVTSYLSIGSTPPSPAPTSAPHLKVETPGANATIVTANHGPLHVRQHPDMNAAIIASYANGSRVQVLSQKGAWYYAKVGSHVGYLDAAFVKVDSGVSITGSEGYDGVVANPTDGEILHLRAEPTTDSESLGEYHNGTYVKIVDMGTAWHHVIVDGIEGYMDAGFVEVTSPEATADKTVQNSQEPTTPLHAGASTSSDVIAQLENGAIVTVEIPDVEWSKVLYDDNGTQRSGYIQSDLLQEMHPLVTEMQITENG